MNHLTSITITLFSILLLVVSPPVVNADNTFLRRETAECGVNEEFVTCHSSSCFDETCESLNSILPRRCTRDCRQGCACVKGYVRDQDRSCYPSSTCLEGEEGE